MTHMASNIQVATGLLVTPLKDEECCYLMYELLSYKSISTTHVS